MYEKNGIFLNKNIKFNSVELKSLVFKLNIIFLFIQITKTQCIRKKIFRAKINIEYINDNKIILLHKKDYRLYIY